MYSFFWVHLGKTLSQSQILRWPSAGMSPPLLLLLLTLWLGGGPGPLSPPGPGSAAALKLENYHDPETGRADPEVKESLQLRQPRFLFRVKRKIPDTTIPFPQILSIFVFFYVQSSGTTTITSTLATATHCYTTAGITGENKCPFSHSFIVHNIALNSSKFLF